MSVLTLAIIIVFIAGYVCIAIESVTHINKAADEEIEEFVKDMEEHCLDNNT